MFEQYEATSVTMMADMGEKWWESWEACFLPKKKLHLNQTSDASKIHYSKYITA